jgi:hypothetical protein
MARKKVRAFEKTEEKSGKGAAIRQAKAIAKERLRERKRK